MVQYISNSAEETFQIGYQLGLEVCSPSVICFFGDLAAGKTTFIKGLITAAAQVDPSIIQSPTFTYLHIYEGSKTVYHFDLYRLRDTDEFLSMGFDEYFELDGICCLEWSERIIDCLPRDHIRVILSHLGEDQRLIHIITSKNSKSG